MRCTKVAKIKITTGQDFVKEWSIEGHITKVVEWILMDFGFI